jgi:hypothetical protein
MQEVPMLRERVVRLEEQIEMQQRAQNLSRGEARRPPRKRQKPGLWCRQKFFELMQKFAISGKVTRRILLLHFSEHSACSVESVGIRLDIGR